MHFCLASRMSKFSTNLEIGKLVRNQEINNWKRIMTGSGWPGETGSRFRWELEIGKLAGNQEPAGFWNDGSNRRTSSGWRRFQRHKFSDSPPSPHICASAS